MRRWVKFGGVSVGAGLLAGFGVVAWLYLHRNAATLSVADSGKLSAANLNADDSGTAIPLPNTPSPTPYNGLEVTNDGNQGSVTDGQTSTEANGGTEGDSSNNSSSNSLPDPSGFGVYDQYATDTAALYIDTQPGTGKAVAKGSVVTVEYSGWLTNGTEFGAVTSQNPYTFTAGSSNVIAGFQEGVFGMKAGGERRIIVPPSVGYGSQGKTSVVPPNAVLVFDVTLVSVK